MIPTNLLERVADAALRERRAVRTWNAELARVVEGRLLDLSDPASFATLRPLLRERATAQTELLAALDELERAGYDATL